MRVVAVLFLLASQAAAQLDLFEWDLKGSSFGSGSLEGEVMTVTGPDDDFGCDLGGQLTYFETSSPIAARITVDVDFLNLDPGFHFDAPVFLVNGVEQLPCCNVYGSGDYHFDFEIQAGDTFGLGAWAADCVYGPGIAVFTNFVFEPHAWLDLGAALDPRLGPRLVSPAPDGAFGAAVAGIGDLDGDGTGDLVVGVPSADGGKALVLSSADGAVLLALDGPRNFGTVVAGVGDVDGDGWPDLAVGAPDDNAQGYKSGSLFVYSGRDGSLLFASHGTHWQELGSAIDGAGDVNGDGFDDVIVGGPSLKIPLSFGVVKVLGGPKGEMLFEFTTTEIKKTFGRSVSGRWDVSGDGTPDFIVSELGKVFVFSGIDGSGVHEIEGPPKLGEVVRGLPDRNGDGHDEFAALSPNEDLIRIYSGKDAATLLEIPTIATTFDAGKDVSGDGVPDIVAGYRYGAGFIQVFSGVDGSLLHEFFGESETSALGTAVALIDDVDGDGIDDVVAGSPGDDALRIYHALDRPGAPTLTVEGIIQPDEAVELDLDGARANAPATLFIGGESVFLPFKGGTLVPAPDVGLPFVTGPHGQAHFEGRWPPNLPAPVTIYLQAWIVDDMGPKGLAASNAVSGTGAFP